MTRDELRKFEPVWGEWYVQELIGKGAFGDVYRITRQSIDGNNFEAALKVISVPRDRSELNEIILSCGSEEETKLHIDRMRQEIAREISLMEQLKGRTNIVSFEDYSIKPRDGAEGPGYDIFIRMELLSDLNNVIRKEFKTWKDNSEIVKIGIDIAEGIRVCHNHQIIHRDIKPMNIFRSKDGDYKIGDFGIARSVSNSQMSMSIKGTYNYMAPEVYNQEHYDLRADIYSLGMVLYYLLNRNRGPFVPLQGVPMAEQTQQALGRRMHGEKLPNPIMASEKLAAVVLKACEYRKEDRYATMWEFGQALRMIMVEDMQYPAINNISKSEQNVRLGRLEFEDSRTILLSSTSSISGTAPKKTRKNSFGWKKMSVILVVVCIIIGGGAFAKLCFGGEKLTENSLPGSGTEKYMQDNSQKDVEEVEAKIPCLVEDISVYSNINESGLIFEKDLFETIAFKASFCVSEDDSTEVSGRFGIDNPPEVITQSGNFSWFFEPDDNERFQRVTGVLHITAIHKEWVVGIEELSKIQDPSALYQVDLSDCGLKDLDVLKGADNLAVLDVSNNSLQDISILQDCKGLQQLYLDNNSQLADASPIYGLKNLSIIMINNTAIKGSARDDLVQHFGDGVIGYGTYSEQ